MFRRLAAYLMCAVCLLHCAALSEAASEFQTETALADGIYSADFITDSSMFRINEALDGKGTLTVSNGVITIHITLNSKKIVNLYPGKAEDAKRDGATLLQPTEDQVTYPDGWTETVYGFDVPVPALEAEFDLALVGTKGKWYDHKVKVSNPVIISPEKEFLIPQEFSFSGGSGRVAITCEQVWMENGQAMASIAFSSPHYTYVKVEGIEYPCTNDENRSVAVIPVNLNENMEISAQTTAMSTPHEISYSLYIGLGAPDNEISGLKWRNSLALKYAEGFTVDFYDGGYALIDVKDSARYLVVPESMPVPEGLNPAIIVLQKPLDHIYMSASAVMSLFDALNALDAVRFSSLTQDNWYVENAAAAMERGEILFAGKYNEPNYEMLLLGGCDLAVESMMILHVPQVRELIELLKIPVFVDRSSNEPHPLGRVEWIKLYGVLLDRQGEAETVFDRQALLVESLDIPEGSAPFVAFFSIRPDGSVTVRGSSDYIARSIELAGGHYVFESVSGQETNASVTITMETFYMCALDADYLIYNSAIEKPVYSIDELISTQPLLSDFKTVGTGNVFSTKRSLYQSTDEIGTFIEDLRKMLSGETDDMVFLYKLQ